MSRPRRSLTNLFVVFLHCLITYSLVITLCAPWSLRRVEASAGVKNAATAAAVTSPVAVKKKGKHRDGELIVRFREGVSEDYKNLLTTSKGGRRKGKLRGRSRLERLELPTTLDIELIAEGLRALPEVELAEPNYIVERADTTPNDARLSEQWGLHNTGVGGGIAGADIGALAAWDRTTGAPTTVIAVIDSGIDFTHADLQGNQWTNANESSADNNTDDDGNGYTDDRHGWDWVGGDNKARDEQGHGTMVAGIIAAEGNNATGISGVMWHAGLMNLRVLDNTGTGDVANAVEAIDYAVANGARVINCSWGTDGESIALREAIERAGQANVVVVASAGNDARDTDVAPHYPASYRLSNIISVAASDASDRLASFSNHGATSVTIAAPGKEILTTKMGGGYTMMQGTSAAAPFVAGIAGLIKTERWWLSGAGTRAAITGGVRASGDLAGKVSSGGVASAAGALAALQGPNTPPSGSGGNGGGNGNGSGNGGNNGGGSSTTPRPPGRGAGSSAPGTSPRPQEGSPGAGLPNLDEARSARPSAPKASAPIKADRPPRCSDYPDPPAGCDDFDDPPSTGGDPHYSNARTEPQNQTGQPGVDLGSRNYNWSANLVGLPGRAGMNLDVSLYYNSLVWTKQGTGITFNADKGFPAPGFSLGLPKIQPLYYHTQTATWAYLLVTPSGGRVTLPQVGTSNIYEAIDGSLMQLVDGAPKVARTTDGTQYIFGHATSDGGALCTQIKDRNGNFVSVSHDAVGRISTMTDTLGRVLNFNYDTNGNLASITQQRAGGVYTWATFGYGDLYMQVNFPGLSVYGPHNTYQNVLTQVEFADRSRSNFSYNSWGQVTRITRYAESSSHGALNYTNYNLPADASQSQTDCPRFTERRDWVLWGVMNASAEVMTSYSAAADGSSSQVTTPDNTIHKEFFATTGWQKGLTTSTETWVGGVKQKWTTMAWTQDDVNLTYQKNPRPIEANIYDADGNRKRTTIDYITVNGVSLPQNVREYASDGTTVLRRTNMTHRWDAAYLSRRIIGLTDTQQTFEGENTLVTKTTSSYDDGGEYLAGEYPAVGFDQTNYPASFVVGRANLTAVKRYNVNAATDESQAIRVARTGYNLAGLPVFARDALGRTSRVAYADSYSDGNNGRGTLAYPTSVTDADNFSSSAQYDFNTGAVTRTQDPKGAVTTTQYDTLGRVERVTTDDGDGNANNNAYTRFVYTTDNLNRWIHGKVQEGAAEVFTGEHYDGVGKLRAVNTDMPNSAGGYAAVHYMYDTLGRRVWQSNPTEITGWWQAAGDDAAAGWRWTRQDYDWQSRPTLTTHTDGTTSEAMYGGCGCAGGEQVTLRDQRGRRKRMTKDVLGRLIKTEELNWYMGVFGTANYTYNGRDQLTSIDYQGQVRTLEYDGYARLAARVTPEQGRTTYGYYANDAVQTVTDARGVVTNLFYNNRGLTTNINFTVTAGVTPTANIAFDYDAAGNRTWMTDGTGRVDYTYDTLSQLKSETRQFTGLGGSYALSYSYNMGGGLTKLTNPFGVEVGYAHDQTGRLTGVTGAGYAGVSTYLQNIGYRASGAIKSQAYGNGKQFTATYDSRLRLKTWDVAGVAGGEYAYDSFSENTGRVTFARNTYDDTLDRSFDYDEVGRVSESSTGGDARMHAGVSGRNNVWNDGPYYYLFLHDQWGNSRFNASGGARPPYSVDFNAKNQMVTSWTNYGDATLTYDAAGNLTWDGAQSFTYDATGQQASASTNTTGMEYDGDRLRAKRTEGGVTTYYLRSSVLGGAVVCEGRADVGWTRGYVYGGGGLLALQQENQVEYVHQDPVTKSQRLSNQAGAVSAAIELDAYGREISRGWNTHRQPQRFTTYQRDANGGDEAMHRRYSSWWGRFDQPDPYDGSYDLSDPQSFNRYAYVGNDPVNFTDPSGLNGITLPDEQVDVIADPYDPFDDPFFSDPNYGGRGVTTVMPELPFPTEVLPGTIIDPPNTEPATTPSQDSERNYLERFLRCMNDARLDNAIRDIGRRAGYPTVGEVVAALTVTGTAAAIGNTVLNYSSLGRYPRAGVGPYSSGGGPAGSPTTWQHRASGWLGHQIGRPQLGRYGRNLGRFAARASGALLAFEGGYIAGNAIACAALARQ